ncbi:single-stranded DNA-binding protein [Enterococcus mediterraneensis]|uniref:single-stranded DNA-binding protein n=1 Tax=Enterococcus mediterraneensis TaxID=2364791 RepID=UPI000F059C51|nr:single-stranded DNA-binding protein [Enterococcus mediterraneensis]
MINNVTLVGRLAADPDLRYTSQGTATASFRLAVNRNFTNQSGEREADFISCVIWRKAAENLANYAKKGSLVGVTGRIQTRFYENQQGQRVYVTEVVVESFSLLESKRDGSNSQTSGRSQGGEGNYTRNNQSSYSATSDPFSNTIDISSDDLPF